MTSLRSGPSANTTGTVTVVVAAAGLAPAAGRDWDSGWDGAAVQVTVAAFAPVAGSDGTCGPGTVKLYLITFSGGATQFCESGERSVNDEGPMAWDMVLPSGRFRTSRTPVIVASVGPTFRITTL